MTAPISTNALQAIKYTRGSLQILDQLRLPHESVYVPITNTTEGFNAIKSMQVRGAPAIAIVAALSLAVELANSNSPVTDTQIEEKLTYLIGSRPTAVNLQDAVRKLGTSVKGKGAEVKELYIGGAEKMLVDDVADNKNIGKFGAEWILEHSGIPSVKVLTHCNTGSLATAEYGTALGIIRSLHAAKGLEHAYCTETRPYNQGARLTAFELVHEKIPATLITDSMASHLLKTESIQAIIVGADRVAANGDTANKIGTYQLAITAKYHKVRFIVAAPTTSIDLATATGADIHIEERPGEEVTFITGPDENGTVRKIMVAAEGINVINPSFDITPAELIDAIITERGAVVKEQGSFDLESVCRNVPGLDLPAGEDALERPRYHTRTFSYDTRNPDPSTLTEQDNFVPVGADVDPKLERTLGTSNDEVPVTPPTRRDSTSPTWERKTPARKPTATYGVDPTTGLADTGASLVGGSQS